MHARLPVFPEALKESRVLIVDDIAVNRIVLCAMLCRAGLFNLAEAEDGAQALRIISEWRPTWCCLTS